MMDSLYQKNTVSRIYDLDLWRLHGYGSYRLHGLYGSHDGLWWRLALFVLLAGFLGGLTSCSHLSRYLGQPVVERYFMIEKKWVRDTTTQGSMGFFHDHRMETVVTDDILYQGNAKDGMSAYERKSGDLIWRKHILHGVDGGAQFVGSSLYFGGGNGYFYSLDARTGDIQWTFFTKYPTLGRPFVHNRVVYFLSGNNTVYALDTQTGRQKWLYARPSPSDLTIQASSRPLFHDGVLYVGFTDGFLVALVAGGKDSSGTSSSGSSKRGQVLWERQLSQNKRFQDIDAFPVKEGNRIYISSYDGNLFCLNARTGQTLWKVEGGGHTAVTIEGDRLFYSTSSGFVKALDKKSGKELWKIKLIHGVASQPKFFRGLVVFGVSQGGLRVVDATHGSEVGKYSPGRGIASAPSLDAKTGEVYFISQGANLFALKMGWKRSVDIWPWEEE